MESTKVKSDLIITIKEKRRPRFKAGADLTDKVNLVDIEVDEQITEDSESLFVSIHLQRSGKLTPAIVQD